MTSNDADKVPKLQIEVPEFESPDLFPPSFASRLNLGQHSPMSQTPKHSRSREFAKPRTCTTPSAAGQYHKIPLVFIIHSNNLTEKGSLVEAEGLADEEQHLRKAKFDSIYREHLIQTYQSLRFVKELKPVDLQQLRAKRVTVPRRKGYEYKKTVIFDLDETLVHCCEDERDDPGIVLPVRFPTGETVEVAICVRPYALECLRQVSRSYEVIVFTASHQCYADAVLDYLDADREIIHHRFYRQHCVFMDGVYIKDLRIFANRKIKDMIIVDNFAHSFAYQLDNGIPIISWVDYEHDIELHGLIYYLRKLVGVEDVREMNKKNFRLREFVEEFKSEVQKSNAVISNSDLL
jgi:Dullard-like phosphatase family protein